MDDAAAAYAEAISVFEEGKRFHEEKHGCNQLDYGGPENVVAAKLHMSIAEVCMMAKRPPSLIRRHLKKSLRYLRSAKHISPEGDQELHVLTERVQKLLSELS